MKFNLTRSDPTTLKTDCLVVGILAEGKLTPSAQKADRANQGLVRRLVRRGDIQGNCGETLIVPDLSSTTTQRLLLVGLGKASTSGIAEFKQAADAAARALSRLPVQNAVITLAEAVISDLDVHARVRLLASSITDATYHFDQLKSKKPRKKNMLNRVSFSMTDRASTHHARRAVQESQALASGLNLARDLSNLPGNICTPTYLATQARKLRRSHGLKVSILDERKMEQLGMGSLLSVSKGSRQPAKLIIMEHQGGGRGQAPIALIGKGLTFDAGGISLKPAGGMHEMKYDMCGGASVFGALVAVAEMGLKLNVIGMVPSSENLPDGAANKPGDIVTSMSGKTIEILNTDAEGRLILCDALTYAERYKPAAVIDIATLTGACVVALGHPASAVFSNNDELAGELLKAGEETRDRAWHMPLWDEYQAQLRSGFADVANIGGRGAGAVTAACFLSRFAEDMTWAHLDIAGSAWKSGTKIGATGRPVTLLTQFLINRAS